jgi:uncharacterized membrane protein
MPTSPRPYKRQEIKNLSSQDPFVRPKSITRATDIEGERRERLKRWITFYRRNPVRFIQDYFGIKLHPYQILMIWILQRSSLAYIVASRAAAKTWIIAVWSLTLATLYPGIKIIVCSKTLKQGGILLSEKLTSLQHDHSNVAREIEKITCNPNNYEAVFKCGSTIRVVPSSDSARGNRANYIIIEESRLVPKEILEQVIKPFLEVRTPPYRLKKEYENDPLLKEEGTISYITSAWYKSEYWFTYVRSCINRMVRGDTTANFLALDKYITLYHNIKTEEMLKNETADMDEVSIDMEYNNIPSGTSGKSYFKPALFSRTLKQASYPQKDDTFNGDKNPYGIPKLDGEIRIVTTDIATRANKINDNSIIGCIRMIPYMGRGYERHLSYMESHKGEHVGIQAKRIKEIFYDFEADYLCLDLMGTGIGVFDSLSENTISDERGITFPPMTIVGEEFDVISKESRDDLVNNHTRGVNALPIIFPILASQDLNSQIAAAFRISLQKKLWKFLIGDGDAEEYLLRTSAEFRKNSSNDSDIFSFYLNPFVQTGLLVSECINLDMSLVNGKIKLSEKSGKLKDRYSAISYANYVISTFFDSELLREARDENPYDDVIAWTQFY